MLSPIQQNEKAFNQQMNRVPSLDMVGGTLESQMMTEQEPEPPVCMTTEK